MPLSWTNPCKNEQDDNVVLVSPAGTENLYLFFFSTPDTLLSPSKAISGRMGKSHSSGLLDDPNDEEYEYMNKQTCVTSLSPRHNIHCPKPSKMRTVSTSSQATACSNDTMFSAELRGSHTMSNSNSDSEQQGSNEVEYEYMDIRGSDKDESPPGHCPSIPPPPLTPARVGREVTEEEEEEEEEDEYVEDSNYHYTNRQPKLRQALQDMKAPKTKSGDEGQLYEYEDMEGFATLQPGDIVVYQNLQRDGAVGGPEAQRSGFEAYVKVRAGVGVGEPAAGDRSFDNPDYWHSRMYLKPKAVPT